MKNLDAIFAHTGKNVAPCLARQCLWRENALEFIGKMFHELCRDVRSRISDRRSEQTLVPNLVKSWKNDIAADQQRLVFLRRAFYALYQHSSGEASILQNTAANQSGDGAGR